MRSLIVSNFDMQGSLACSFVGYSATGAGTLGYRLGTHGATTRWLAPMALGHTCMEGSPTKTSATGKFATSLSLGSLTTSYGSALTAHMQATLCRSSIPGTQGYIAMSLTLPKRSNALLNTRR